ncbi:EcsC family protein [Paenibacillus sp. MBLB4367]|uniref:EcsC family protein n=1 Tax=Paenibacillus sp. MBLB4367 TaxID=3384767 RepID=UPI003907E7B4
MSRMDNLQSAALPETREALQKELQAVEAWERDQKDLWFWEKLGRLPFMLLDKVTPKFLQDKIGQAIDEVGSYVQTGGQYLISERTVLQELSSRSAQAAGVQRVDTVEEASRLPLSVMDAGADEFAGARAKLAAVQGATTGIGGIFTLAIDIPALLGLSLKVLQEIALCYGYNPKDQKERMFVVLCLQFASSDIVGKRAILEKLASFDSEQKQHQAFAQLQGWREVVATYRDNFGWKKLFQMVPIAGMLFGAFLNKGTLQDVAEAGKMLYRKRRIMARLNEETA